MGLIPFSYFSTVGLGDVFLITFKPLMIMITVFILSDVSGKFRIVEAFERRGSFSHSDGDILGGFENKENAKDYCSDFNFIIVNN